MNKKCIGVITEVTEGFYYGVLLKNIHQEIVSNNMQMVVILTRFLNRNGLDTYYKLASNYIDGYIILPNAVSKNHFEYLSNLNKPIVMVGRDIESDKCHYVLTDNVGGTNASVEHLIQHGHKNIAFIADFRHYDMRERHKGYQIALEENGIPYEENLICKTKDTLPLDGKLAIKKIIDSGTKFTAVVCGNDYLAQGAIDALLENGYLVPDDIAVFGYDDFECAKRNNPPISSVIQDVPGLGKAAGITAIDLINGKKIPYSTTYLNSNIVTRLSCSCKESTKNIPLKTEKESEMLKKIPPYMEKVIDVYIRMGRHMAGANLEDIKDYAWLLFQNAKCGCLGLLSDDNSQNLNVQRLYYSDTDIPQRIDFLCSPESFPPEKYIFQFPSVSEEDIIWLYIIRSNNLEWGVLATVTPLNDISYLYNFNHLLYGLEAIVFSIDREAFRKKMILKENHLRSLLNNAGQGFLTIDSNLIVEDEYSSVCIDIFQKDIENQFFPSLIYTHNSEPNTFLCNVLKNAFYHEGEKNTSKYFEVLPSLINIHQKKLHIEYKLILDESKRKKIMVIMTDITEKSSLIELIKELKDYNMTLDTLSQTDELTGLYNRRGFFNLSQQSLKLKKEASQSGLLFLADMDGLKKINDAFGHEEGDIAIKEMAKILNSSFRKGDIVARIGGDEFAVLTSDTNEELIETIQNRINYYCDLNNENSNKQYKLSISLGVSKYNNDLDITLEQLMIQADKSLYGNKKIKKL